MTRFHLVIEYDGRGFMGWQRQPHGPTIQQSVEEAILATVGTHCAVHAAGRTDAGVHAYAMSAHVDIDTGLTPFRLAGALNAHLRPQAISVLMASEVPADWHARFTCTGRAYVYRVVNRRARLALDEGRAWLISPALDIEAMIHGAACLIGRHDFTTFRSIHCQAESPIRTLDRLDVVRDGDRIAIHAAARSFLHHQVRSIVGCLALVGRGRWSVDDLQAALDARDRTALGLNAPPDGLYFVGASYPNT